MAGSFVLAMAISCGAAAQDGGSEHAGHGDHAKQAGAAGADAPYAGQETRDVKSLSSEQVQGYLAGHVMGLARPAELNHYPGPRHVLDLAPQLALSDAQVAATRSVFESMRADAVRLGARLVAAETELDAFFSAGGADESRLAALLDAAAAAQRELRMAHLRAHLAMRSLLTAEQIARYDALRGYSRSDASIGR